MTIIVTRKGKSYTEEAAKVRPDGLGDVCTRCGSNEWKLITMMHTCVGFRCGWCYRERRLS